MDATSMETPTEARLHILSLFDDAAEIVSYLQLQESRVAKHIQYLQSAKDLFVMACSKANAGEFQNHVQLPTAAAMLHTIGDAVAGARLYTGQTLDRKSLLQSTDELALQVREDKSLPEYARRFLLIEMEAMSRVVRECQYLSDDDIRRRIKAIYADFCAEYAQFEKPDPELLRKVTGWAKKGMVAGVLTLGLAGDAASVAGYLESNKEASVALPAPPKALPNPESSDAQGSNQ